MPGRRALASRGERAGRHQPATRVERDAHAAHPPRAGRRAAAARPGLVGEVPVAADAPCCERYSRPARMGGDGGAGTAPPSLKDIAMQLALNLSYAGTGVSIDIAKIQEAERLGYASVWTAEAYGSDAVAPAAWIAARTETIHVGTGIMQIPARTPAMTAMTAMTLDGLSGRRFRLGLGVSGPQVGEGWHGQAFGKPLARTREAVEAARAVLRREKPVAVSGEHYPVPDT